MTSRHTISHADELYSGNAFRDGYSPDGRRGIKMTHLYAHEFLSTAGAAPLTATDIAILSSYATPSAMAPTILGTGGNFLQLCSGTRITLGTTLFTLDVPRNITFTISENKNTTVVLVIEGHDAYGQPMVEQLHSVSEAVQVCGQKAFKTIHNLHWVDADAASATNIIVNGSIIDIGVGDRLGLPFHLADQGKFISLSYDGQVGVTGTDATQGIILRKGLLYSTDSDSSMRTCALGMSAIDVRGTVRPVSPKVPDASTHFTALMIVDHTTDRKAFGAPQAAVATVNY